MTKLFNYRTKIQNEADDKKGMTTTHSLDKGQTLRIILPGKGVFASEIVGNGNFLVINVPRQKNLIPYTGEDWVGKVISVYLWRKGDARYVFDTTVTQSGLFLGKSALFLKHSSNLVRTQKRKSVRVKCEIYGMLYIIKRIEIFYLRVSKATFMFKEWRKIPHDMVAVFIKSSREDCSSIFAEETLHICSATKEGHSERCFCAYH